MLSSKELSKICENINNPEGNLVCLPHAVTAEDFLTIKKKIIDRKNKTFLFLAFQSPDNSILEELFKFLSDKTFFEEKINELLFDVKNAKFVLNLLSKIEKERAKNFKHN